MGRVSDAKQRLLDATIELIWQHSYGAVRVDDICNKAGVKKGSFYYFFPSKTDLVVAALDAHWHSIKSYLDQIFSPTLPPLERLHQYFQLLLDRQQSMLEKAGRVLGCPFSAVGSETSCSDPVICQKIQELMSHYFNYLRTTITDLQSEGTIKKQDVDIQLRALAAYIHGAPGQARIQNDLELVRAMEAGAMKMLGIEPALV